MKRILSGSRFSIHWLDLGFLGWVFKLIVGSRDSIPRVHIIWYQSKVSNQVWFYLLFLVYLILGLHCFRVKKKKKKKKKKRKVAAELHCSSVCVGWNLLFKSLYWLKLLVLEFVLAQISYSRVFELLFRFCQLLIRLIVIKSVAKKKKNRPKK